MKRRVFLLFLLNACLALSAESFVRVSIHVDPVSGVGAGFDDNLFFTSMLEMAVEAHNFVLVGSSQGADYSIYASLSVFDSWSYLLMLEMYDNVNNRILVEHGLVYRDLYEAHVLFASLLYSIFPNIPVERRVYAERLADDDVWRNRRLYAGGQLSWAPRIYTDTAFSTHFASFGAGLSAEWHFFRFFAVGAGVGVSNDWVEVTYMPAGENRDFILDLPVTLRFVLRPGDNFMLQPYGGGQFNVSMFGLTSPSVFSWVFGFQYGVKAGMGVFFLDGRLVVDQGRSRLNTTEFSQYYNRYLLNIGVGYKLGFWRRGF